MHVMFGGVSVSLLRLRLKSIIVKLIAFAMKRRHRAMARVANPVSSHTYGSKVDTMFR